MTLTFIMVCIRIPALGEKLETSKEVFTVSGVTFSLYGIDKTDEELLIYAHVKNDTNETIRVNIDKTYHVYSGYTSRTYWEDASMPKADWPAAGTEADVTYHLKYPSDSREVSDSMTSFSFNADASAGISNICYMEVSVRIGEALPCELDFENPGIPMFGYKRGNRSALFDANGISIRLMDGIAVDVLVMNLMYTVNYKPIKIAFENLVVNGEPAAEVFEFVLDTDSDMAEVALPFESVETMTCDFAVYDAETGAQIFEKTRVILGEVTEE